MTDKQPQHIPLTANERSMLKLIAQRDGITEDEAASNLMKAALKRITKKKGGGGGGGRVVPIRRR